MKPLEVIHGQNHFSMILYLLGTSKLHVEGNTVMDMKQQVDQHHFFIEGYHCFFLAL